MSTGEATDDDMRMFRDNIDSKLVNSFVKVVQMDDRTNKYVGGAQGLPWAGSRKELYQHYMEKAIHEVRMMEKDKSRPQARLAKQITAQKALATKIAKAQKAHQKQKQVGMVLVRVCRCVCMGGDQRVCVCRLRIRPLLSVLPSRTR